MRRAPGRTGAMGASCLEPGRRFVCPGARLQPLIDREAPGKGILQPSKWAQRAPAFAARQPPRDVLPHKQQANTCGIRARGALPDLYDEVRCVWRPAAIVNPQGGEQRCNGRVVSGPERQARATEFPLNRRSRERPDFVAQGPEREARPGGLVVRGFVGKESLDRLPRFARERGAQAAGVEKILRGGVDVGLAGSRHEAIECTVATKRGQLAGTHVALHGTARGVIESGQTRIVLEGGICLRLKLRQARAALLVGIDPLLRRLAHLPRQWAGPPPGFRAAAHEARNEFLPGNDGPLERTTTKLKSRFAKVRELVGQQHAHRGVRAGVGVAQRLAEQALLVPPLVQELAGSAARHGAQGRLRAPIVQREA
mmetsp:Transcript_18823/g.47994  ORF Transcript_18823/g.47994 Transcript_18823/m.47994 type:complete len:369 (-) Transcript_18823:361-1467(-)